MQFDEGGESSVDLALGAGLQDPELHSLRARRFLRVSKELLDKALIRVRQHGNDAGSGNQFGKQIEPLRHPLADEVAEAGEVIA